MAEAYDVLLEKLRAEGEISAANVRVLTKYMELWKLSSFEAILHTRIIPDDKLADLIAQKFKIHRYYNLTKSDLDVSLFNKLDYFTARQYGCLPVEKDGEKMRVIFKNPCRVNKIEELEDKIGCKIIPGVASSSELDFAIGEYYDLNQQFDWIGQECK